MGYCPTEEHNLWAYPPDDDMMMPIDTKMLTDIMLDTGWDLLLKSLKRDLKIVPSKVTVTLIVNMPDIRHLAEINLY